MKIVKIIPLALAAMLLLCACTQADPLAQSTDAAVLPAPAETGDALSALRSDMKPPIMAVADFGFPELRGEADVMNYLLDEYPSWMNEMDFIGKIPPERFVRACSWEAWGQLVCIVPRDPAATVCVNLACWEDGILVSEEVLYRSESGDPILLLTDMTEYALTTVIVTDSDGRGVSWSPYWGYHEALPDGGYAGHLVMDFTPDSEKSPYELALRQGWEVPQIGDLEGGFWLSAFDYGLELQSDSIPGDNGGNAIIYDVDEVGALTESYRGSWFYEDSMLHLLLVPRQDQGVLIDDVFPVLRDPWGGEILWIGRSASGIGLPHFTEELSCDELMLSKG